ncbi:MAG: hypothetical protein IPK27_13220 [Rhodanobacteraceae bacterium]|nr:hypothetical protein [Rhodanobacteraceae bacterium]
MRNCVLVCCLCLAAPAAMALECPDQAAVEAALTRYITKDYWSTSERETWKITDVSGFQFSPIKAGRIIQKQVEWGRSAEDVCPVRAEYSFAVTHADGRVERTEMGEGKTHLFYLDGFDEWTFKIE